MDADMRANGVIGLAAAAALLAGVGTAWAQARKAPYYASIGAGEARMRTGPGRNYPVEWLYLRAGLPVKVIETYPSWRKIEDPDGTTGWMQANLLTDTRTAVVRGGGIQILREQPQPGAKVAWRVEPKVIGRISRCENGWCRFDVRGRAGFIEVAHLWGVEPGEAVE
jgi:SH3-like domain-containing protein